MQSAHARARPARADLAGLRAAPGAPDPDDAPGTGDLAGTGNVAGTGELAGPPAAPG